MTDLLVSPSEETETDPDEGSVVHITCCFSSDTNTSLMFALCGAKIDNLCAVDYTKDVDCDPCDDLDATDYCPIFGDCLSE